MDFGFWYMETILVDVVTSEYSLSLVDMIFVLVDLQLGCLSERKKFLEMTLMLFLVVGGN